MTGYNETIGNAVGNFRGTIKTSGLSFDAERKILSILMSMEYQVEHGEPPPVSVIRNLQTAIRAWLETYGQKHKKLFTSLDKCVDIILKELGDMK